MAVFVFVCVCPVPVQQYPLGVPLFSHLPVLLDLIGPVREGERERNGSCFCQDPFFCRCLCPVGPEIYFEPIPAEDYMLCLATPTKSQRPESLKYKREEDGSRTWFE